MKKFTLFLISILLLAGFVSAGYEGPSTVPEGASWVFSFNVSSGTEYTVTLGGNEIVKVFSSGAVVPFSKDVIGSSVFGGDLVVHHAGLSEGTYTVSINGSDSKEITVVPLVNESEILSSVNSKVDSKLSELDGFEQSLKNLEVDGKEFFRRINENTDNLSSFNSQIDSVQSDLSTVKSDVASLDSRVNETLNTKTASLEERLSVIEGIENERQAAKLAEEEAKKISPVTGFVTAAQGLALPIGAVLVVALVVVLAFIVKSKLPEFTEGIYGPEKDEHNLPVSYKDEAIADEIVSGGKWKFPERD